MSKFVVNNGTVAKARMIANSRGVLSGSFSSGKPATAGGAGQSLEKHCLTALLERVERYRLYNSRKGGWYTKGVIGNKKELDNAALNYFFSNPSLFRGPVTTLENLNDQARETTMAVVGFLDWLYPRINDKGVIDTKGFQVKLA